MRVISIVCLGRAALQWKKRNDGTTDDRRLLTYRAGEHQLLRAAWTPSGDSSTIHQLMTLGAREYCTAQLPSLRVCVLRTCLPAGLWRVKCAGLTSRPTDRCRPTRKENKHTSTGAQWPAILPVMVLCDISRPIDVTARNCVMPYADNCAAFDGPVNVVYTKWGAPL